MKKSIEKEIENKLRPFANPGSPEAIRLGCTCSKKENRNGEGYLDHKNNSEINGERKYTVNLDCPLHGLKRVNE